MAHQTSVSDEVGNALQYVAENLRTKTVDDRVFISLAALRKYFTLDRIGTLLNAVEAHDSGRAQCEKIRKDYLAIFVILLSINEIALLNSFIRRPQLRDRCLPFREKEILPEHCRQIFGRFDKIQWMYCALELRQSDLEHIVLDSRRVIPIIERSCLGRGDSRTWRIKVHPDYNHLGCPSNTGHTYNGYFVLKLCEDKHKNAHENEVKSYRFLGRQEDISQNIVRYYGSWSQGGFHSILLEYVHGGTLEDLLHRDPQVAMRDMVAFWDALVQLWKPLIRLHSQTDPQSHQRVISGAHQDIKPKNILVHQEATNFGPRFVFKLADFGLTCVPEESDSKSSYRAREFPGTQVYSSPEAYRDERDSFQQCSVRALDSRNDIWSFACVLSEVIVWCVLGCVRLDEYRKDRQAATAKIDGMNQTAYSGCFHDGNKVLHVVQTTFAQVHKRRALADEIIGYILPIIERMFEPAECRLDALRLQRAFQDKLDQARDYAFPPAFQISPTTSTKSPSLDGLGLILPSPTVNYTTDQNSSGGTVRVEHAVLPRQETAIRAMPSTPKSTDDTGLSPSMTSVNKAQIRRRPVQPYISQPTPIEELDETEPRINSGDGHGKTTPPKDPPNSTKVQANTNVVSHTRTQSAPAQSTTAQGSLAARAGGQPDTIATIEDVLRWIDAKKADDKKIPCPLLPGKLVSLRSRDQVFIIDNSTSTAKYKSEMRNALQALIYVAKGLDNDGVEIHFTNSIKTKCSRDRKDLLKLFDKVDFHGDTIIETALSTILNKAKSKRFIPSIFRGANSGTSVYIFTDGAWDGQKRSLCGLDQLIRGLASKHGARSKLGIQFIQFGNDETGTWRLQTLDDLEDTIDIVDVERHTGDVHKMLLGHLSAEWDDRTSSASGDRHSCDKQIEVTTSLNNLNTANGQQGVV